eukprot:scaffold239969_cov44-Prasinocladus_malaysianus.AAC.1
MLPGEQLSVQATHTIAPIAVVCTSKVASPIHMFEERGKWTESSRKAKRKMNKRPSNCSRHTGALTSTSSKFVQESFALLNWYHKQIGKRSLMHFALVRFETRIISQCVTGMDVWQSRHHGLGALI